MSAEHREVTSYVWEYAVREHDGKVSVRHDNSHDSPGRAARDFASSQNRILASLRIEGEAVVLRRKVWTTTVTTTTREAWQEPRP